MKKPSETVFQCGVAQSNITFFSLSFKQRVIPAEQENTLNFTSTDDVVSRIGTLLEKSIHKNDTMSRGYYRTCYSSDTATPIPITQYLANVVNYVEADEGTCILMLCYLDAYFSKYHIWDKLNAYNVHRLILVSLLLAHKYLEDDFFFNDVFARVGGVTLKELNDLELSLLMHLRFGLYVSPEKYADYRRALLHCDLDSDLKEDDARPSLVVMGRT
ncbi:MAG: hypothetical protein P1U61_06045 [Legionellaceae bacterium]|nr:hypothetical protein [Legionellaceae bacterium]